jgi:hypothetical protein
MLVRVFFLFTHTVKHTEKHPRILPSHLVRQQMMALQKYDVYISESTAAAA